MLGVKCYIQFKIFEMKTRCKSFLEHDSKSFYGSMNLESCIEHIRKILAICIKNVFSIETVLRWGKVTLFCFMVYIVNCNIKTKTRKQ